MKSTKDGAGTIVTHTCHGEAHSRVRGTGEWRWHPTFVTAERSNMRCIDKCPRCTLLMMSRELLHRLYITMSVTILVVVLAFSGVHRSAEFRGTNHILPCCTLVLTACALDCDPWLIATMHIRTVFCMVRAPLSAA